MNAFLAVTTEFEKLRAEKIGHTIVSVATDHQWSQYFCCMLAGSAEYVEKYPVATKRVVRAILKSADLCASIRRLQRSSWSIKASCPATISP